MSVWKPKPYKLNGWEFQFDEDSVKAFPEMEVLQKKIAEAAQELSREITRAENGLMLMSLTDDTLENLIKLCKNQLAQRKKMRASFKL